MTKLEYIYVSKTCDIKNGKPIICLKIGHSINFPNRLKTYRTNVTSTKLLYSFLVAGQTDDEDFNLKKALNLERKILDKFSHLKINGEVLEYSEEIIKFIKEIKKIDKIKNPKHRERYFDNLFLDIPKEPLFIEGKSTKYFMNLTDGIISSNNKIKEYDCEERIQLNLDKKNFGQIKKSLTKEAHEKLFEEHRNRYNFNGVKFKW